jgi:hypothetical protein
LEEQVLRFIDESEPLRGAKVGVYFQVRDLLSRNLFSGTGPYHPMPQPSQHHDPAIICGRELNRDFECLNGSSQNSQKRLIPTWMPASSSASDSFPTNQPIGLGTGMGSLACVSRASSPSTLKQPLRRSYVTVRLDTHWLRPTVAVMLKERHRAARVREEKRRFSRSPLGSLTRLYSCFRLNYRYFEPEPRHVLRRGERVGVCASFVQGPSLSPCGKQR